MRQSLSAFSPHATLHLKSILPYLKKPRFVLFCAVAVAFLLIAAFLSFSNAGFVSILPYRQNIEVLTYGNGLYVAVDEALQGDVIRAGKCQKISCSLDGTIAAFLTDTKELYLVNGKQVNKIADDVLHFEISSTGQGVAFAQKYAKQNALTLYTLEDGTRREITTLLENLDFSLSPDGQSLAYYTMDQDRRVLMYYRKGQSIEISEMTSDLVGLSNEGKFIYAVCDDDDNNTSSLCAFNHRGQSSVLGSVTSISFKFNQDHRQIMFYDNGRTLVSINGRPAVEMSSYPLYLVTAANSQSASDGNSITLPVTTLYDHIYTCSDGESTSAWLIRKDPQKSEKLVSRVSGCTLDASAQYLYFIHEHSNLCVMNISKGVSRIHVLSENADSYSVTSDRKKVYYTKDGILYSTSGKKSAPSNVISTDFLGYNLVMGASDTLYYIQDTDLYACRNGRKQSIVARNVNSIYNSSNNIVYIIGDDAIYIANNKKQPVKVLGSE